ncbi:VQ [Macleaya cordata]|uniref:VQ n=1 Tax=Macleaya cordata TaxID=56857 RepID=A0A200PM88_MACCD|nr:VQ [Macleaya cordata]
MDSGNSGSLNSSSGGDDDQYDSRTESISAFLNSSNQQPPPPLPPPHHHHHNHQQSSIFDPLSTYLDPFSRSPPTQTPNSLLNLDMVWPKNLIRSEPNCTNNTNDILMGSSSSSISSTQLPQHGSGRIHFPNPPSSSISLQPAAHENGARGPTSSDHHQTTVTRNSKKRSRASRRAPTTVLTTDTSNFRAMVQEFTGIPAPPFSASTFPRSRFDLFNTSSTMKSIHLETPPPYLLRPFPHKVHQLPSFSTSITTTTTNTSTTSNSTSTNNYLLPSEIGQLSKVPHQQNLLNMQNPILTFQSLLQPHHHHHHHQLATNVPMFGDKSKGLGSTISSSTDSQLKMGVMEEFSRSTSHGGHVNSHLGGLSNIITSTSNEMSLRTNNWGDHNEVVVVSNNNGDADHQSHLSSSFNGNVYSNSQRVSSSCKMNFSSASSSDFHTEKGSSEKVISTRGEGMLDSWICSSD